MNSLADLGPARRFVARAGVAAFWWLLALVPRGASADGAVAVSAGNSAGYGIAVDAGTPGEAESAALKQCGQDCRIELRFREGCASFASGRYATGWMQALSSEEAAFGALQACRRNGTDCVTRVTRCEGHEQRPGDAALVQQAKDRLATRVPDAVLTTPANAVRRVDTARTFTFPKGTRFTKPLDRIVSDHAAYDLASAAEWMTVYAGECVAVNGKAARWTMLDPPCAGGPRTLAIPSALLVASGEYLDPPVNAKPIRVLNAPYPWSYRDLTGFVDPGTRLYKADDQHRTPAQAGYLWPKEQHYTWFYVDPAACAIAGKVFDCSQPMALSDAMWAPLGPAERVAQASSPAVVSATGWELGGIRTGAPPHEVQTRLEAAGYHLTVFRTSYRYRDPVSGNLVVDNAVTMVSMIAATQPGSSGQPEDTVTAYFTPVPGSEQVYAVARSVNFNRTATRTTLLAPLRQEAVGKFGTPLLDSIAGGAGNYAMYWSAGEGRSALKPWVNEPDLPMVALECGQQVGSAGGAGVSFLHLSPLESGVGPDPQAVRSHCGGRFVAARMSLAPTSSQTASSQVGKLGSASQTTLSGAAQVMQYFFWLYDADIAQSGRAALLMAETQLTQQAAARQTQDAARTRPKL